MSFLRVSSFIWRVIAMLLISLKRWMWLLSFVLIINLVRFICSRASLSKGFNVFLLKCYCCLSCGWDEYIIAVGVLLLLLLFRTHHLLLIYWNFLRSCLLSFAVIGIYSVVIWGWRWRWVFLLIMILLSGEGLINYLIIVIRWRRLWSWWILIIR